MKTNFEELSSAAPLRKDALEIVGAGLSAIDTAGIINSTVRMTGGTLEIKDEKIRLEGIRRIFIVGIGKCAFEAGEALEKIIGERLTGGITLDVRKGALHKIKSLAGTHPVMSDINIDATKEIIALLTGLSESDLVLFIISGGGSALLCQPNNFTCQDESMIVDCLVSSGVPIGELNTVRKHLSLARGGYLAQYSHPAKSVSLIFSDVPGDNLEFVASGPTMPDTTTVSDAEKILGKYDVWNKCGTVPLTLIETPKHKEIFENVRNILVCSNRIALESMKEKAEALGYGVKIMDAKFSGEAGDVAARVLKDIGKVPGKTVLLYGGESTVKLRGSGGVGGRNQELALAALNGINPGQLIASVATDGRDNTDHAGAIADEITKKHARETGAESSEYLKNNDSYSFFKKTGDFLLTGNTGSNVSDIIIAIKE